MPLIDYSFLNSILPKVKIKKSFKEAKSSYLWRVRIAMSVFFFGMGFCFASWASRIPDLKLILKLSEAALGSILFALPIGQLCAMPLSGKVVNHYGCRKTAIVGLLMYALCMPFLGLSTESWHLATGLFIFGFIANFCSIAVNTQGVYTQQLFDKPVMGSFHGSWSLAGFSGALVGLIMLSLKASPSLHFAIVFVIVCLLIAFNYKFLVPFKEKKSSATQRKFSFKIQDKNLIWLGIISFCCMASEGIMFDWSGIYFKEIIKAPGALAILGYTSFMITMAIGRFLSDVLVAKFGAKKVLISSGLLISIGLYAAVLFPYLISCTIAFMLVGFGVSNVVPIVFNEAGKSEKTPTSIALTIVSSIGFLGFLIGPPFIGYIAELTNLKYSFAIIGLFGLFVSGLVFKLKLFQDS
jgi:MFS family permease